MAGKSIKGMKGFQSVEGDSVHTGTEAWNIAQYFTGYSIALPLKELNDLEDIARFGSVKLDVEFMMDENQFAKRRGDAVQRYWQKLKQIVADTLFKVRAGDRSKAEVLHGWLKDIPQYFNALLKKETDAISHEDKIKVNEEFLILLLNDLVSKKEEYLYVLDRAGLIFREVDEVDLDKMTKEFVHGG